MKLDFNEDRHYIRMGVTAFLVVAASLLFYYTLFHGVSIANGFNTVVKVLAPVLYGLVIAFLLTPIARFLEEVLISLARYLGKELKGNTLLRWICVILALVFFLGIIYGLLAMVLPELIRSITKLINSIPSYMETIQKWIDSEDIPLNDEEIDLINSYSTMAQEYLSTNLIPQLQSMVVNITSGVFDVLAFFRDFLIGCLISLYVMADRGIFVAKAKKFTYAVLPVRAANFLIRGMRYAGRTFSRFISGKITDSAIIGMLCYIGCSFIGTPYTVLVSVVIGVTNVIPFFGPFLGAIPCIVLILLVDPIQSLYFLLFILVLQQFDGNILGPKILGDSTGLSSFMVIVAILIGGGFFGIPGMLMGVPGFAVCYAALQYITNRALRARQLDEREETYRDIDCLDEETMRPLPLENAQASKMPSAPRRRSAFSILFMKVWDILGLVIRTVFRMILMGLRIGFGFIGGWIHDRAGNLFRDRFHK